MIDFNSFSNFWLLVNDKHLIEDCSDYFKNQNFQNKNIFELCDFLQPVIASDESFSKQVLNKILHFKSNPHSVNFRGTAHTHNEETLLIAWPFFNNIKEITRKNLGSLMEHPACIMTDFLILKDVLSKQQEKIKKLEIERIEKQLVEQVKINQHQSKLATIGEIASGVGHEISNPLTIVKLNNAIILKKISENEISIEEIEKRLEKQSVVYDRIAKILLGLKTFTRIDEESEQIFCLQNEILITFDMIYEIYKNKSILIETRFDDEPIYIKASKGLFNQVLMNLISNSKDALQSKTGEEEKVITIGLQKIGTNKVSFRVSDNGEGIDEENIKKILKPFFTTKASGEGTGIGLTVVQNFVHKSNAELLVDSTLHKGTTFTIIFDTADSEA
jgi:signal transduction histidine kinase